jgi:cyclase
MVFNCFQIFLSDTMLKKRLIFTLLYDEGFFVISRNFRLQRVGDINWLINNYDFALVSKFIDELIILDVTRGPKDQEKFLRTIQKLFSFVFIPVAVGGGVSCLGDALHYLSCGADKVVVNTLAYKNPMELRNIIEAIGSQSVVASIDYKKTDGLCVPFVESGSVQCHFSLLEYIHFLEEIGVGEIFLHSIEQDGTGQGYDISVCEEIVAKSKVPIICSGGAGKKEHFLALLSNPLINACATAHLFNFIGNSFQKARSYLLDNSVELARW